MSHQIYPNMYQSIANNIRHLIGGEIWEISLLLNSDLDKCSHYRPREVTEWHIQIRQSCTSQILSARVVLCVQLCELGSDRVVLACAAWLCHRHVDSLQIPYNMTFLH